MSNRMSIDNKHGGAPISKIIVASRNSPSYNTYEEDLARDRQEKLYNDTKLENERKERKVIRDVNIKKNAFKDRNNPIMHKSANELINKILVDHPKIEKKHNGASSLFGLISKSHHSESDVKVYSYISSSCRSPPLLKTKAYYETCGIIENKIKEDHPELFYSTKTKDERLRLDLQIWLLKEQYIRNNVNDINELINQHKNRNNNVGHMII